MSLEKIVKSITAFFGALVGFLYGGMSGVLVALLICILFDFITGISAGVVEHTLSSKTAFEGIFKKFGILVIVSLCHIIDVYVLGEGDAVFNAVAMLYVGSEGISIIENAVRLGVPVPKKLYDCLVQLRGDSGGIVDGEDIPFEPHSEIEQLADDVISKVNAEPTLRSDKPKIRKQRMHRN